MTMTGFPKPSSPDAKGGKPAASWDDLRDKTGRSLKCVLFVKPWGCYVEGDRAGPKPSEVQSLIDAGVVVPVYKDAGPGPEATPSAPTATVQAPAPPPPVVADPPKPEPEAPAPEPKASKVAGRKGRGR